MNCNFLMVLNSLNDTSVKGITVCKKKIKTSFACFHHLDTFVIVLNKVVFDSAVSVHSICSTLPELPVNLFFCHLFLLVSARNKKESSSYWFALV